MSDASHPEFRLAVVGAGSWGTTLAGLAAGAAGGESGGPTVLWAREPEVADSVNHAHVNPLFLRTTGCRPRCGRRRRSTRRSTRPTR